MIGKKRRLGKILKHGRTLIVPMDHGVSKPEEGLEDVDRILEEIDGYVDAVVLHKGIVKYSSALENFSGALIIHLSASTSLSPDPNDKRIIGSVERALALGADAVSVHINLSSATENRQLEEAGKLADECDAYGIPMLAMVYPRGSVEANVNTVKHAARVAYEIGADLVKVPYVENFREVVRNCKIPVVVAGGSKDSEEALYAKIQKAMASGAAGAAVGRNVFGNRDPRRVASNLYSIIHGEIAELIV